MKPIFNKALRTLLATNSLIMIAGAMLIPIYAIYVKNIGGDLLDASLTGAIFAFTAGTTSLLSGKYADHIKRKDFVIILGSVIMSFGFLLFTIVDSIFSLFVIQAIIGFGQAIYYPPYEALYSAHIDSKKTATAWRTWESIDYFTTAIGAIIGGVIVNTWGFSTLFVFMSIFCLWSGLYVYYLPRKVLN